MAYIPIFCYGRIIAKVNDRTFCKLRDARAAQLSLFGGAA